MIDPSLAVNGLFAPSTNLFTPTTVEEPFSIFEILSFQNIYKLCLFYNLIKDRKIKYHFANCGTFDERYNDNINNLLQIQGIYNTNKSNTYINYISNKNLFKDNIYDYMKKYFLTNFDLDPST